MKPKETKVDSGVCDSIEKDVNIFNPTGDVDIEKVNPHEFIKDILGDRGMQGREDAFYVVNLKVIESKFKKWISNFPGIKPYYEVRCNNDPTILIQLRNLGVGFACSSKGEIDELLTLGVTPASILLTSACKVPSHIRHAAIVGVTTMMFDNKYELQKIKDNFPAARLVLQIKSSDQEDMSLLENQYGCPMECVEGILTEAQELKLNVIGISFQVSGVQGEGHQYVEGLDKAMETMSIGAKLGFSFELLDIGGGFPGESNSKITFAQVSSTVMNHVRRNFKKNDVQLCAEVGVFLVNSACQLVANIIGKREVENLNADVNESDTPCFIYYINDGLFGPTPPHIPQSAIQLPELPEKDGRQVYPTSIWDQTATNGQSCTQPGVQLPELVVGDWVVFADCGAYTFVTASNFTSPQKAEMFYVSWEETPPEAPKKKKKAKRCVII